MYIKPAWALDDVLLVPKHSDIESRENVDISVDLGKGTLLSVPIASSNMANITGVDMANAISNYGGLPILHRFASFSDTLKMFRSVDGTVGCSVGVKEDDQSKVDSLVDAGCRVICVDVAHGHNNNCARMVEYIAKRYPNVLLIAGNVATASGAIFLHNAGADIIKTNVGSGSICSTRIETGNGVPSLTALEDVYIASCLGSHRKYKIMADGGFKRAGDLCKGLCFSDVVMLGNMLAGTDEAPGNIVSIDGYVYKEYSGSSTHKSRYVEGVKSLVPCKGPVKAVLDHIVQGLRSGLSYQGAHNLEELREDPEFVSITNSGLVESHPHNVKIL